MLPLLTRWLGPEGFGLVGTFLALVSFATALVGLSTQSRISVSYYRDGHGAMVRDVGASFAVAAGMAAMMLAMIWIAPRQIAAWVGLPSEWLWAVCVCAFGQFVLNLTLAVWQSKQMAWHFGAAQIGFTVSWMLASIVLIGLTPMDWQGRIAGQVAAALLVVPACLALLTRHGDIRWQVGEWPVAAVLRFGMSLLPHSLGAIAMTTVDRLVLGAVVGPETVGYYFTAVQITMVLSVGAAALNQAWIPWMYARLARDDLRARQEVIRATYLLYGLLLGGASLMVLLRQPLVSLVAGPGFEPAAELLVFLAPAAAFSGMYYLNSGYLFYVHRTGTLSCITVGAGLVQLVLINAAVGSFGVQGVAAAVLATAALYWAATATIGNKFVPMPWFERAGSNG